MLVFLCRFLGEILSKSPFAFLFFDHVGEPKIGMENQSDRPLGIVDCPLYCGDEQPSLSQTKREEPNSDSSNPRSRSVFNSVGMGTDYNNATSTNEESKVKGDNQSNATTQALEHKSRIGPSHAYGNFDLFLLNIIHGDCKYLTSKYFAGTEVVSSKTENLATEANGGELTPIQNHNGSDLQPKQRKGVRLRDTKMKPPPGFNRMGERKRQKEFARRQQQQNHASSSNSTTSEVRKAHRKQRLKSRLTMGEVFDDMINGEITEAIPEDTAVCFGSPSHDERIEKFRDMFREEQVCDNNNNDRNTL